MFCRNCGDYISEFNSSACYCKPYEIFNPDTMDEDDTKTIWAKSKQEAADKYVESEYYDDPCDPDEFEIEFYVSKVKFNGTCQKSITFSADEV